MAGSCTCLVESQQGGGVRTQESGGFNRFAVLKGCFREIKGLHFLRHPSLFALNFAHRLQHGGLLSLNASQWLSTARFWVDF